MAPIHFNGHLNMYNINVNIELGGIPVLSFYRGISWTPFRRYLPDFIADISLSR